MGWRYECELWLHEDGVWSTGYMGDSLLAAVRCILRWKKWEPGRAYRLVIR